MTQMTDFIEFIVYSKDSDIDDKEFDYNLFSLLFIQASSIIWIESVSPFHSNIHTSQGRSFSVMGNYKCNTNRLFYALRTRSSINLAILKPSDFFYHRMEKIDEFTDNFYYDKKTMNILKGILNSPLFILEDLYS